MAMLMLFPVLHFSQVNLLKDKSTRLVREVGRLPRRHSSSNITCYSILLDSTDAPLEA